VTRVALSFFVSGLVLVMGTATAWVQSGNFALGARLDEMQLDSEWFLRRRSRVQEELERIEFAVSLEDTRGVEPRELSWNAAWAPAGGETSTSDPRLEERESTP